MMLRLRCYSILVCLLLTSSSPAQVVDIERPPENEEITGQPPPPADPVIWANGECRNSKGPAGVKDRIGICGDLGFIFIGKDSNLHRFFSNARLMGLRTMYATITRADFSNSQLEGASLTESNLIRSSFKKVDCRRCRFNGSFVNTCNFEETDLSNTVFRGSRVNNSTFIKANLNGADFRGANLTYTSFQESDLRGANFAETVIMGTTWKGSRADATTVFPFSKEEATRKGIVFNE